jgi:branched-chain amino acid transport system substrate-binding protein
MLVTVSRKCLLIIISMVLVLVATPLLSACGGSNSNDNGATTSGTTSDKTVEKEFRIGYMGAVFGSPDEMDHSIEMAIDEINKAGGVQIGNTTYKFKFCFADDKQTASGAVAGIQKLLYNDKTDAITMNNYAGGLVVQPYTEREKQITFAWDLPDVWLGSDKPYSFRLHSDYRLSDLIALDWVRKNTDDKKIQIIQLDMPQFHGIENVNKEIFAKEWGLDVHYTWYDFTAKDFYPILTDALKNKPDAIVVTQSAGYALIQQARELGFKGDVILPEMVPPFWYDVMSPADMEGLISMSPALDSPQVPQAYKDYLVRYTDRVGRPPYADKTFTDYVFVYLMAAALKAAGSPDSDKLKEALETQSFTLEFPGGATMDVQMFGKQYYGVDHNWQPNQYVSITHNGKIEIKEVLPLIDQLKYLDLIQKYKGTAGAYTPEPEETVQPTETSAPRKLTIDSTVGALLANPETRAILEKHIPKNVIILEDPEQSPPALLGFSLKAFFSLAGDRIDQSKLPLIEEDLNALYGE